MGECDDACYTYNETGNVIVVRKYVKIILPSYPGLDSTCLCWRSGIQLFSIFALLYRCQFYILFTSLTWAYQQTRNKFYGEGRMIKDKRHQETWCYYINAEYIFVIKLQRKICSELTFFCSILSFNMCIEYCVVLVSIILLLCNGFCVYVDITSHIVRN